MKFGAGAELHVWSRRWGFGDNRLPADYDGNGRAEIAIWQAAASFQQLQLHSRTRSFLANAHELLFQRCRVQAEANNPGLLYGNPRRARP